MIRASIWASILNGPTGDVFDVDIVGHTDNVPVSRPATKQRYPNNMHLSVGRAMAVRSQLVSDKVVPTRIKVGGWGEHRPLKQNPARGGEPANRRVDLYLVPATSPTLASAEQDDQATGTSNQENFKQKLCVFFWSKW